jgi:hypothetical protein
MKFGIGVLRRKFIVEFDLGSYRTSICILLSANLKPMLYPNKLGNVCIA